MLKRLSHLLDVKNVILISLLILMFLNIGNYWYALAVLPVGYLIFFKMKERLFDVSFFLLLLYGLMYILFAVASEISVSVAVELLLVFPFLYIIGKHIGHTESDNGIVNIMYILSLSLAVMYMLSISESVANEGFLVDEREVEIEGMASGVARSATGIYSNLMILSVFLLSLFLHLPYKKKIIYVLGAALAIYSSVRLQSRTSIMLLLVTMAVVLILNIRTIMSKHLWTTILSIVLIAGVAYYVTNAYEEELGIIERFQNDDVETAGDRTLLAQNVINRLADHPFGGLEHMAYAHNLWLDTARVAGLVPLGVLLLLTLIFISSIVKIYTNRRHEFNYRFMMLAIALAFMIYMNTEPIIEGSPILFGFFCLFMGVVRGHNNVIDAVVKR